MNEVHPEQLGLHQHHLLPNVIIYQNGFTGNLILAGDLGVNENLIDKDYPVFYIHESNWNKMVEAKRTGNEYQLRELIGENINYKRIREMSKTDGITAIQHTQGETNNDLRMSSEEIQHTLTS